MKNLIFCLLLTTVAVTWSQNTRKNTPCIKDPIAIYEEGRECGNPCNPTRKCKNPKVKCLCDGACGTVCIPEGLRCDPPEPIAHGKVTQKAVFYFGHNISYSCDEGYDLIGLPVRKCQGDETWSGIDSFCTLKGVQCEMPPFQVENGFPDVGRKEPPFYPKQTMEYKCMHGFSESRGAQTTTTCTVVEDGNTAWLPDITLKCYPKHCKPPPAINDGEYAGREFTFGKEVVYHCNPGFQLFGRDTLICTGDGSWSGDPPFCEVIQCHEPSAPAHGKVTTTTTTYKSTAWFSCDDGYYLIGTDHVECGVDGFWDGETPTCREIKCQDPPVPENGKVFNITSTNWNGMVHYACNEHTSSPGIMWSICALDVNGEPKWSLPPPVCLRDCDTEFLENVDIYEVSTEYYNYRPKPVSGFVKHNKQVKTTCKTGFEIIAKDPPSPQIIVCQDESWSEHQKCTPARCKCRNISKATMGKDNLELNESCSYNSYVESGRSMALRCSPEYPEMKSPGFLSCERGKWKYTRGHCSEKSCRLELDLERGRQVTTRNGLPLQKDTIEHGTSIQFHCTEEGFELYQGDVAVEGRFETTCNKGSMSNMPFPTCRPAGCTCPELNKILKADSVSPKNCPPYGRVENREKAHLKCAEGYSNPENDMTALCSYGRWTSIAGACIKRNCFCDSLVLPNTVRLTSQCHRPISSGEKLQVTCAYSKGSTDVVCNNDGTWSPVDLDCQKGCSCHSLELPSTVRLPTECSRLINSGEKLQLVCANSVAKPVGPTDVVCNDGIWSPVNLNCYGSCSLPEILNGHFMDVTTNIKLNRKRMILHGDRIVVTCSTGYKLARRQDQREESETVTIKCTDGNLEFTPTCVQVKPVGCRCSDLKEELSLRNIIPDCTDHVVDHSSTSLTCQLGTYRKSGTPEVACANSAWGFTDMTCEEVATGQLHHSIYIPSTTSTPVQPAPIPRLQKTCIFQPIPDSTLTIFYEGKPLLTSKEILHGATLWFQCNDAYMLIGSHHSKCLDGVLTPSGQPSCHRLDPNNVVAVGCNCSYLKNRLFPRNIIPNCSHGVQDDSFISLTCRPGTLHTGGAPMVSCVKTWGPIDMICEGPQPSTTPEAPAPSYKELAYTYQGSNRMTKKPTIVLKENRSEGKSIEEQGEVESEESTTSSSLSTDSTQEQPGAYATAEECLSKKCDKSKESSADVASKEKTNTNGKPPGNNCKFLYHNSTTIVAFYQQKELTKTRRIPNGNNVIYRCVEIGRSKFSGKAIRSCTKGSWETPAPECKTLNQRNTFMAPVIDYELIKPPGDLEIAEDGAINVPEDGHLVLSCLWFKSRGVVSWTTTARSNHFQQDTYSDKLELEIYTLKAENSGIYTCTTPYKHNNSVTVNVITTTRNEVSTSVQESKGENEELHVIQVPISTHVATPAAQTTSQNQNCVFFPVQSSVLSATYEGNLLSSRMSLPHGAKVTFVCFRPHIISGSSTLECNNGVWTHHTPSCVKADERNDQRINTAVTSTTQKPVPEARSTVDPTRCVFEPDKNNYVLASHQGNSLDKRVYLENGAKVWFRCSDAYSVMSGSVSTECIDGQWTHPNPTCRKVQYYQGSTTQDKQEPVHLPATPGPLLLPQQMGCLYEPIESKLIIATHNGQELRSQTYLPHGAKIRFRCTDIYLYTRQGELDSECNNGAWTNNHPRSCEKTPTKESAPKNCRFQLNPDETLKTFYEGKPLLSSMEITHGATLRFRCDKIFNHQLIGSHEINCLDGILTSSGQPRCRRLDPNNAYTVPPLEVEVYGSHPLPITDNGEVIVQPEATHVLVKCLTNGEVKITVNNRDIYPGNIKAENYLNTLHHITWIDLRDSPLGAKLDISCNRQRSQLRNTITIHKAKKCTPKDWQWSTNDHLLIDPMSKRSIYVNGDILRIICPTYSPLQRRVPAFKMCLADGTWGNGPMTTCQDRRQTST